MQTYVIVRNLTKGPSSISDHRQGSVILSPYGQKGDSIKIITDDMKPEKAVAFYRTFRNTGIFQVVFSDGLDDSKADPASKSTVISTAAVDQSLSDRVAWLREKAAKETVDQKNIDMRLTRARAMNTIADNSNIKTALTNKEVAPEPVREPLIPKDDGIEMTADNLSKMNRPDLFEIASKMGIQLKKNASVGGIIKAILLTAQVQEQKKEYN